MTNALRILAAIVLAALASRAGAGPAIACPDGPDPLRFRPEFPVAAVAGEAEPLALAASVDAVTGAELVALAYLTPARDVAVALSSDGGCTFAAPVTVSSSGAVTERPSIALRATAPALVAVSWTEGGRVLARAGAALASLAPAVDLEPASDAVSGPRVAVTQEGPALLVAAWIRDAAGRGIPSVARSASGADAAAWSAPEPLAFPGVVADVQVACDSAGAGGGPGCTLLAGMSAGDAWVARLDEPVGAWSAPRVASDASASRRPVALSALAASPGAGPGAWTIAAWAAEPFAAPGTTEVLADAARTDGGAIAADFEGVSGGANAVVAPAIGTPARPAAAASAGAAFVAFEDLGEIRLARRALQDASPRLAGGCGPAQVTGLSPMRPAGAARSPSAAALADDVVLAFVDDRRGSPEAWVKRSDSRAPAVALVNAAPSACGAPPRVDLSWTALPCDAALVTVEVGSFAGATDFTRVAVPPANGLSIEGLQPATGYFFRLRVLDTAGNEQVTNEVSALLPSCSGALLRSSVVSVVDACAAGGAGGDGLVDPGETLRVTVRVSNDGGATAAAARARIVSRSGFVTVRSPGRDLGDLAPGASADATFDLDVSATAPCGAALPALLRADVAGAAWGDLVTLPVPAACTPCRLPACAVTADASRSAPLAACLGGTITLDAGASTSADCAGTLLYEWRVGAGLAGTGALLQQVPGASVTYVLTARCSTDLACEASAPVDVTIHPLPTVTIAQDPPPPRCAGGAVTLTASSEPPGSTFAWSDGTAGDRLVVTSSGTQTVTATDGNGCRRSRTVRVEFGEIPRADAGPDVTGCGSRRIGTPGYPLLDYSWDPVDGLSDPRAAQPLAQPGGPPAYTLTVTDPLTGCSATDQVVVALSAGPGPVRGLRVARAASGLALSWEALPGASTIRAHADFDARSGAVASAASPTARLLCDGATACVVAMPPEPLVFVQAVGACADGIGEGPN